MNLTEPQIEAVFEWIDLNVDRKTAIRFVKDFYHTKSMFTSNDKEANVIPKHLVNDFFDKATHSEIMNAIQHGYVELSDWVKWGFKSPTNVNEFNGKPNPTNGIQELLQMKMKANEKAFDPSPVDESERESLEKYKRFTLIESYSYPGTRLQVNSIEDYGQKNKTITAKCYHPAVGYVSAVIAHRNFMGTGNTYWATIVE